MVEAGFVNHVRLHVLEIARQSSHVPDATEVARALGRSTADVIDAFRQLGEGHVYVVEPGDPTRLRMANPFSAVPTRFKVEIGTRGYFGNCVWDGLGIVSLLGGDGRVVTHCPDCRETLVLEVKNRRLVGAEGVVHFGVPMRNSWNDIIFT